MFTIDSFVLENSDRIRASLKRYTPQFPSDDFNVPKSAQIIVLFAHGLGDREPYQPTSMLTMVNLMADKEHWEPVIKELFEENHAAGSAIIKEAWAIDCQDHGESAILNENELESSKRHICERSISSSRSTL